MEIIAEKKGALGIITLNRPHALNALNLGLLQGLWDTLTKWRDDPGVQAIALIGAGEKAFCAGGDLKHFHGAGQAYKRGEVPLERPVSFFRLEYSLNKMIYHYPKPLIALMNGITMGGGYGVAGNSRIRVACESTLFAMPETKIGFFPDVGAMAHLVKAPGHLGRYLAMSGLTLSGDHMVQAGLAEYIVEKSIMVNILRDMSSMASLDQEGVERIIQNYSITCSDGNDFSDLLAKTDMHFSFNSVDQILESLNASSDPWAKSVLAELEARAPLSVVVALEHYNRAVGEAFDTIIERDFQLCARFIQGDDLYEGIRALLIDKDKNPRWEHKSIKDVTPDEVAEYFVPRVPPLL